MIDGVISFGPSHDTPVKGAPNVAGSISVFSPEPRTRLNSNEPFASVLVDCTLLPRRVEQVDPRAGDARARPGSTLPGVPPPGLEVAPDDPVTAPAFGVGGTACSASAGTSDGRDRRQAHLRRVTRLERSLAARSPRCGVPVSRAARRHSRPATRAGDENQLLHGADARVDRALLRILDVHHVPDHAGREERDRHRHEDDRLERDGPADALGQHREDETDRRDGGRRDERSRWRCS